MGPTGRVVGVELHPSLVEYSQEALERWTPGILDPQTEGYINLLQGNALEGATAGAPAGPRHAQPRLLTYFQFVLLDL